MAHSRVPLAILPGGTAHVLARELGLPLDIQAAARSIRACSPHRISLGRAGQRYFLLLCGVGFDALVVSSVDHHWKKRFGMGSYLLEAFRQLWTRPLACFRIRADGHCYEITFACIAKAQHYGPIRMVREASLFSEEFHIYCFPSAGRLRYLAYAVAVLTNQVSLLADVKRFSARQVHCEPIGSEETGVMFQVDGELAGQLPCTFSLIPDALTLMVPAGA
jgi:diacylglycerol kinase family enzyme